MPRRVFDYPLAFKPLNIVVTFGSYLTFIGMFFFFFLLLIMHREYKYKMIIGDYEKFGYYIMKYFPLTSEDYKLASKQLIKKKFTIFDQSQENLARALYESVPASARAEIEKGAKDYWKSRFSKKI